MAEQLTPEERIEALEEAAREETLQRRTVEKMILDIVERTEGKVDALTGSVRALQINSTIVDARLNAMDARLNTVEARLGTVDAKLDQVISLLRRGE